MGGFESHTFTFFVKEIFLNIIIALEDFLSYFCYILNVYYSIFCVCFCVCVFFFYFFSFFTYNSFNYTTCTFNNKKGVSTSNQFATNDVINKVQVSSADSVSE